MAHFFRPSGELGSGVVGSSMIYKFGASLSSFLAGASELRLWHSRLSFGNEIVRRIFNILSKVRCDSWVLYVGSRIVGQGMSGLEVQVRPG